MNKKNIIIKDLVAIVFIVIMLVTVGLIGYIVFSGWLSATGEIIQIMAEDMNSDIFYQVDEFVSVPMHINEAIKKSKFDGPRTRKVWLRLL